ncbi:MAG: protease modulator HflC [Phycisphaerae bacterium]|nr:protease modulator HflC [Phycisphaerae bacterium]
MKVFWALAILIVITLTVWSVCFSVHVTQYAIVTRFGDPVRVIEEPGFRVKWLAPIESVVYLDRRLLVLDAPSPGEPAREFLTMDKKNVEVSTYTCWRIKDPLHYLKALGTRQEAEASLGVIVASELGKVLGEHELSALLSIESEELKLASIMEEIREACAQMAKAEYGIEVIDFRIKRINFPEQNRNSVFQRMRAERKRIATRYRSEGEEEAIKIRATADKKRTVVLADAYRQAKEIEGQAEAQATRIYAGAYGQDPEFYEFLRTLESYETSLTKGTTVILPADSPYLKLLSLEGASVSPTTSQPANPAPAEESVDDDLRQP